MEYTFSGTIAIFNGNIILQRSKEQKTGNPTQFGTLDLRAIFRQSNVRETQEYFVYFKFIALSSGGKGPQSVTA
jgi:hypothetical protein